MSRAPMRYRVRNAAGEELVVPSLADLNRLYTDGFVSDDDLVRAESADRWVRAGALAALQGARERRAEDPRKVALLIAALIALATGLGILLSR